MPKNKTEELPDTAVHEVEEIKGGYLGKNPTQVVKKPLFGDIQ